MGSPVEDRNATAIARCTTSGFWPASINVVWMFENVTQESSSLNIVALGNHSFSVTSDFETSVLRSHNRKTLTCNVTHVTLASPTSTSVRITVLCRLRFNIVDIKLQYRVKYVVFEKQMRTCMVFYFSFTTVYQHNRKQGDECKWDQQIEVNVFYGFR